MYVIGSIIACGWHKIYHIGIIGKNLRKCQKEHMHNKQILRHNRHRPNHSYKEVKRTQHNIS